MIEMICNVQWCIRKIDMEKDYSNVDKYKSFMIESTCPHKKTDCPELDKYLMKMQMKKGKITNP